MMQLSCPECGAIQARVYYLDGDLPATDLKMNQCRDCGETWPAQQ